MLNVEQFHRFMSVIKKLGDRVEREHDQFLRDSQRLEDRSAVPVSGAVSNSVGGEVNFENLVGGGDGVTVKADTVINGSSKGWDEDDVWGSIFSSDDPVGIFFSLGSVQVYSSFSDLLGHHTDTISPSRANSVITINSDDHVQFTTDAFKSECAGCQSSLVQLFQPPDFEPDEYNNAKLLDPIYTTTPAKQLVFHPGEHQQLLGAEL